MVEQISEKLNIVQFSSEYLGSPNSNVSYRLRGGLGVVVGDISRGLAKNGHSIRLLFPRTLDSYWKNEKDNGVEIEYVQVKDSQFSCGEVGRRIIDFPESYSSKDIAKFLKDFDAFGNCVLERLVNLSASSKLDVVHFHDWHFGRLAEMVSKARTEGKLNPNLKIVSTIHNALYQGRVPLTEETSKALGIDDKTSFSELKQKLHEGQYSFLKTLIDNSDVVVTVGKSYAEGFHKRFPGLYSKKDTMRAVPNGINFDGFNLEPTSPEEVYKKDKQSPILTFASRLVPEKGIDGMILALKELSQLYEVHILGQCSDNFREALLNGMKSDSIFFDGLKNRVGALEMMRKSSVFIAPYVEEEPFGIAPIEALVSGAIPVVTDTVGLKDNFSDIEQDMKNGNAVVMGDNWRRCSSAEKISLDGLRNDIVEGAKRAYRLSGDKIGSFAGAAIINNGRSQAKSGRWSIDKCVNDYLDIYRGK